MSNEMTSQEESDFKESMKVKSWPKYAKLCAIIHPNGLWTWNWVFDDFTNRLEVYVFSLD
jgi:hypothetical protein